jgi:hypothetical protein
MIVLAFSMGFVMGFLAFGFIVKLPLVDQEEETDNVGEREL